MYRPRGYFEIGTQSGRSLTLSRVPSIAVDPNYLVTSEIDCDLQLVRATSDDFFSRDAPFGRLEHGTVDLAFIDGMHLLEFVLRDFINTEHHMPVSGVIVLDDVLPRTVAEASRQCHTSDWAGDVYKLIPVLQRFRPDLCLVLLDTEPTGVLAVLGLDPASTVLRDKYEEIVGTFVVPDPQQVPAQILERSVAVAPEDLLDSPIWSALIAGRSSDGRSSGHEEEIRDAVTQVASRFARHSLAGWEPEPQDPGRAGLGSRAAQAFFSTRAARALVANPALRHLCSGAAASLPEGWRVSLHKHAHLSRCKEGTHA